MREKNKENENKVLAEGHEWCGNIKKCNGSIWNNDTYGMIVVSLREVGRQTHLETNGNVKHFQIS